MKLSVEFPSVAYREGGDAVIRLAQAIESIGYDELDMFDHVIMGYPTHTREAPRYPPQMPIIEALMTLAFVAGHTQTIKLGTEVLVLPQRQPVLVAKQISTLDTLSGGRVRLGVGVGWQESEFDALEEPFANRGRRMDEAIDILRHYWGDSTIDYQGEFYSSTAMAMEPKPPQGGALPIWVGGSSPRALRRVAERGDGWMAPAVTDGDFVRRCLDEIKRHCESIDRDPASLGYQMMLDPPPTGDQGRDFYADVDRVAARVAEVHSWGFEWGALNATAIFQAGARSVDAMVDVLGRTYEAAKRETG